MNVILSSSPRTRRATGIVVRISDLTSLKRSSAQRDPPGKLTGPEKQSREQLDAVEAAYAALDAASRGDDALAAEIVALGVFEASQGRRAALLARNVTRQ